MHALGLDDCLVLLALVCTIFTEDEDDPTLNRTEQSMVLVFAALSIILTTYGIGYHQDTVPTADMIMMEKVSAFAVFLYLLTYCFSTYISYSAYISGWPWRSNVALLFLSCGFSQPNGSGGLVWESWCSWSS